MSPILVRPVREQLEHDRVIRLLQVKLKRKHDVVANIGEDQTMPVQDRPGADLSRPGADVRRTGARKLMGTVEVETAESVNHLEAMAQWAHLGRARAPVPSLRARRLASTSRAAWRPRNDVNVAEIWSYHTIGDQTRFTLAQKAASTAVRAAVAPTPRSDAPARSEARPRAAAARSRDVKTRPAVRRTAASRPAAKRARRTRSGAAGGEPRPPGEVRRADAEKEVSSAVPSVQPRQARLREHVRRPRDRRRGKSRSRILYWFRTPPGVRVGRAALDEDAIRLIEQHNPDIEFDWPRILKGQGSPESEPRPPDIRDRGERRGRPDARRQPGQQRDRDRRPAPPADVPPRPRREPRQAPPPSRSRAVAGGRSRTR